MPVSEMDNVPAIARFVAQLKPRGIMDLGVGFGKYGAICREVLDAVEGRCNRSLWTCKIAGIEGFEDYRNPLWDVYDKVVVANIEKVYETVKGWPLVLLVDVLEHFDAEVGKAILHTLVENNENVIVSVPLGSCPQGAVFDNELERHRTTFERKDLASYNGRVLHEGVCLVLAIKGKYSTLLPEASFVQAA